MSQKDGMNTADLDPFGPWRSFRDATMDVWAKSMAEAVNTEAFAQNMGAYLNTYLATSAPLQKFVEQYMEVSLTRLSMPSRDEVIDLARRMTSIELRLDDMDSKTDEIVSALKGQSLPAVAGADNSALVSRLDSLEARTGELLGLLQELRGQLSGMGESAAAKPAAPRRSRAKAGGDVENVES